MLTFVFGLAIIKIMITAKQLIQVAPFSDDVKKELLEKADSFSPDKKFEVMESCWALISADYQNKLRFQMQKASLEMAKGEKTYSKEDFRKMEDDLFLELVNRLNAAGSQEQIEEIRKQLKPSAEGHLQPPPN